MKEKWNLLQKLGLLLIAASCLLLLGSELMAKKNQSNAKSLAAQLKSILPDRTEGDPANYSDPAMPVLQLDGEDFSGLLEVPAFGVCLPVGAAWDSAAASRYPCCFWGSLYDNSMILGSNADDQLAFCGKLDLGQKIRVTDMTGTEFSYETARIDRRKHASG